MYDSFIKPEQLLIKAGYVLKEKLQSNSLLSGVLFENKKGNQAIVYTTPIMGISHYDILFIVSPIIEVHNGTTPFEGANLPTFKSVYEKGWKEGFNEGKSSLFSIVKEKLNGLKEVDVNGLINYMKINL